MSVKDAEDSTKNTHADIVITTGIDDQFEIDGNGVYSVARFTDSETRQVTKKRKRLLNARAVITTAYANDTGEPYPTNVVDTEERTRSEIKYYDLEVSRAKTGDDPVPVPDVPADDFNSSAWTGRAEAMSIRAERNPHTSTKAELATAIRINSQFAILPTYDRLGWHYRDGEWLYVHGGGAWTKEGRKDVRVYGHNLGKFAMADPPPDKETGARAFWSLWRLFEMGPDRFAAVVIGAAFRASMGRPKGSITLRGINRSGKSAWMAFIVQVWAPIIRWNTLPFKAGKEGATSPFFEHVHHTYGDMIVPWDDLAPTGSPRDRADYFDGLVRSLFNGASKGKCGAEDDRTKARAMKRPRCLGALTAEDIEGTESAQNRTHFLITDREGFDVAAFAQADKDGGPEARSSLMSAFIVWWAERMPAYELVAEQEAYFHAEFAKVSDAPSRYIESVADKAAGLRNGLDFALDLGWVSQEDADALWQRGWAGLVESLAVQVETTQEAALSDRIRDAIMDGLAAKAVYVLSMDGGTPGHFLEYGWSADAAPRGSMIGWTDETHLYLIPRDAAAHVTRSTGEVGTPLSITPRAMGEALEGAGYVIGSTERRGDKITRRSTYPQRCQGKTRKIWKMPIPVETEDQAEEPEEPEAPQTAPAGRPTPASPAKKAVPAPRQEKMHSRTIGDQVADALAEANGDRDKAINLLIKRAIPNGQELFEASRVGGRYDHTAHPQEPDVLKRKAKSQANAIWEARPNWTNPAVPEGAKVHGLDTNAAFLSAMTTHLPIGKLDHQVGPEFDRKRSGVYLITPPAWDHQDLPNPMGRREDPGKVWIARPTLVLLLELHGKGLCDAPVIHESWTSGSSESILRAFKEEMRDARSMAIEKGDDLTLTYVKNMYSRWVSTSTKASRHNHLLQRTDWGHIIRAQAHANLVRKAVKAKDAGLTVYRVFGTDELHVVGDWTKVFPQGRGLNQMKIKTETEAGA